MLINNDVINLFMKINSLSFIDIKKFFFVEIFFCIYILFFSVYVSANVLAQFNQFIASTQSMRGDFIQDLVEIDNINNIKILNTSSGNFTVMRPNKFIIVYDKIYKNIVQADGKKLFIYDENLNKVTVQNLTDVWFNTFPITVLFDNYLIKKEFILEENGMKNHLEWLKIIPKNKDSIFAVFDHVNIGFKKNVPHIIQLHDIFGQIFLLSFKNFEKNPILKPDSFCFFIPKGTKVFNN